jgi:hypothetical protein
MKKLVLLIGVCLFAFVSRSFGEAEGRLSSSPVFVDEKVQKENLEILKQMREDYNLVDSGKKPKFAKFDGSEPLLADGGTATYKGKGYSITVQQTMGQLLGEAGYFYGPILKVEKSQLSDAMKSISSVKFYSTNEFKVFKK